MGKKIEKTGELRERWAAVVGGDHPNTLAVVRSLGAVGMQVALVVVSADGRSFVAHSRYVNAVRIVSNEEEIETALLDLFGEDLKLSARGNVPLLCTSDGAAVVVDASVLLRERFLCPGIRGGNAGRLSEAMGKFAISRIASAAGFKIPGTFWLNLKNGIPETPCGLEFPCIIKPEKSFLGTKKDFRICPNRMRWTETLETLDARQEYVCQPFLSVETEGQVLGVRDASGKCFFAGLIRKPLCCPETHNLGMAIVAEFSPDAFRYCSLAALEQLLSEAGYFGPFSVEFVISGGDAYFVEINFRTDGNFYLSLAGGVNLPAIWCGDEPSRTFSAHSATGLVEISYLKYAFLKNPLRGIADFLRADAFAIFLKSDMRPAFFKIMNKIIPPPHSSLRLAESDRTDAALLENAFPFPTRGRPASAGVPTNLAFSASSHRGNPAGTLAFGIRLPRLFGAEQEDSSYAA